MSPQKQEVYIDANFIVAYFVFVHTSHAKAAILMAQLLSNNNTLCFSPLSLDEAFNKIYEELKKSAPTSLRGYSHAHFFTELKNALDILLQHRQMRLRQFENNLNQGATNALDNVRDFTMRPRDAFHVAYMQDLNIKYVVSKDTGFDKLSAINIERIDF
ncbi:MAG: type II toxin-antitoxin system VapC family toxin [bacterium]|nr:type II toxin-antitoxin system VapC family toxin [bacterium]